MNENTNRFPIDEFRSLCRRFNILDDFESAENLIGKNKAIELFCPAILTLNLATLSKEDCHKIFTMLISGIRNVLKALEDKNARLESIEYALNIMAKDKEKNR